VRVKKSLAMKVPATRSERADRFVAGTADDNPQPAPKPPAEPMKRLTIDIPESLHLRFKIKAAQNKTTMMQVLSEAVEAWTRETG
jgi:hypothetical protein